MPPEARRYGKALFPALGLVLFGLYYPARTGERTRAYAVHRALADTLRGGETDDVLRGTERDDLLEGGGGDDRLLGLGGDDLLRGGTGRDLLDGGAGSDVLEAGDGDDVLDSGDGRDWLFGDAGDDRLQGGPGPDVLDGGAGNDDLHGGPNDDLLDGGEGDDVVEGDEGDDTLDGGDGFDTLDGGPGADNLDGGDENDILLGGAGTDSLFGADGDDVLEGGSEDDLLLGDDGDDVLRGGAGNDALSGRDGNDYVEGGLGDDLLNGGDGDDVVAGGGGNDTLFGFDGDDQLRGGANDDVIRGGNGDDVLDGGDGDDRLLGGIGTDALSGGDGNDVFVLRAGDVDSTRIELIDGGTNRDTARAEADTLVLNGFSARNLSRLDDSTGQPGLLLTDPITRGTYVVTRVEHVVYTHWFAHLDHGAGPSSIQLINPSASSPSTGRIEFVGADGAPLALQVNGDSARPTHTFSIPPLGSVDLVTRHGAAGRGGFRIYADQPMGGVARTALPDQGGVVAGDSPLLDAFIIPVTIHRQLGATTGIAVHNGAVATTLRLTLRTSAGTEVEATEVELPAHGQLVRFVHDVFPKFATFDGSLSVEGGPMAASAIQVAPRTGGFTATPVIPLALAGPAGELRFAHLANGDGFSTAISLVGLPPDTAKEGRLAFLDEDGNPLAIELVGLGSVTSVPFTVAPGGAVVFATTGRGPRVAGSARVTVGTGKVGGLIRFSVPGAGIAEGAPSLPVVGFVAPVRRDAARSITTLVALQGTASAVTVGIALHDPAGRPIRRGNAQVKVTANGHVALPLEELFPRADTREFRGTVVATVRGGTVCATLLELDESAGRAVIVPVTATP